MYTQMKIYLLKWIINTSCQTFTLTLFNNFFQNMNLTNSTIESLDISFQMIRIKFHPNWTLYDILSGNGLFHIFSNSILYAIM